MKILLTGHMGFIGSHLRDYLSTERVIQDGVLEFKHTVIGLDLKNQQDLLTCDLNYDVDANTFTSQYAVGFFKLSLT